MAWRVLPVVELSMVEVSQAARCIEVVYSDT